MFTPRDQPSGTRKIRACVLVSPNLRNNEIESSFDISLVNICMCFLRRRYKVGFAPAEP